MATSMNLVRFTPVLESNIDACILSDIIPLTGLVCDFMAALSISVYEARTPRCSQGGT